MIKLVVIYDFTAEQNNFCFARIQNFREKRKPTEGKLRNPIIFILDFTKTEPLVLSCNYK